MKQLLTICMFCLACGLRLQAQVAITRDGSQPDTSAMLDIKSTAKGILIPRMSAAQRLAIVSPALGLMVFDNDQKTFMYFNGTAWSPIGGANDPWKVSGADIYDSSSTGSVGIGTNTPTTKLDIKTPDFNFGMTHSNGTVRVGTFVGTGGGWVATGSNHPLYFCTSLLFANVLPQMVLTTLGTLGINTQTPNPTYKLDVSGGILSENNLDCSANVSAVVVNVKDSVKALILHSTILNLTGNSQALNFQQATGNWTISENAAGNLEFSYTDIKNNKPKAVVFVMTPAGGLLSSTINPNSVPQTPVSGQAARTIQDQQTQITSLTERLAALEKRISALK